jgi:hypothetical protein
MKERRSCCPFFHMVFFMLSLLVKMTSDDLLLIALNSSYDIKCA